MNSEFYPLVDSDGHPWNCRKGFQNGVTKIVDVFRSRSWNHLANGRGLRGENGVSKCTVSGLCDGIGLRFPVGNERVRGA